MNQHCTSDFGKRNVGGAAAAININNPLASWFIGGCAHV
jgi:hypothetical protein